MTTYYTTIVGTRFRPTSAQVALTELADGAPLTLERDPDNQYDSNAVRVITENGIFIGFIPRSDNTPIAEALDSGAEAVCRYDGEATLTVEIEGEADLFAEEDHFPDDAA